jgi:hypothetical protein
MQVNPAADPRIISQSELLSAISIDSLPFQGQAFSIPKIV